MYVEANKIFLLQSSEIIVILNSHSNENLFGIMFPKSINDVKALAKGRVYQRFCDERRECVM